MSNYIPKRTKCRRIKDTEKAIPLPEYARQQFVVPQTVRYWIRTRKVKGYKSGGRWFIYQL